MNVTVLGDGDIQLGDYPFRMDPEYTTVIFYLTERCNFSCSYCVGWHEGGRDCLTDQYSVDQIVESFRDLRDRYGRKLYVLLTGGEPTLVTGFGELVQALTSDMDIELQTNLCTKQIEEFANKADPKHVGHVVATYHEETLEKKHALRELYFRNFRLLSERGFTVVLKTLAMPGNIHRLEEKLVWLRKHLPEGAPMLVQPYIAGAVGPKSNPGSYPYNYTSQEKKLLAELLRVRRGEILDYIGGAGWFAGMKCDAGRGFVALNKKGDAYRCVHDLVYKENCLGNLMERSIRLLESPAPCAEEHCSAPFWALWYGVDPWNYMDKKAHECRYSRFAPSAEEDGDHTSSDAVASRTPRIDDDSGKA